jgi:hypothetical protein
MWFYVSMGDPHLMNGIQTSKYLEAEEFDIHGGESPFSELADKGVEISFIMGHDNVEILPTLFEG